MGNQGNADKDSDLWSRVLDGDGSAFAELFVLHRDRVFGHGLRLVRTSHEAEDITAMVFLEAWRCRASVRLVNDSIIGWLLVTATNVARNRIRSNLRYEQLIRKLPRVETAPDHGDSVADAVDRDRRSQLLHRAYRSLGRKDQEIIALCVLEEMSTTEVSELLGIPPGTVKSRLSRAKQKLSQLLNPQTGLLPANPLTPEEGTP
ncbi:sigma-70 family RNA polymerase sigma factor [Pseudarthrobacter sp. R1]|uniref:RNA polymerase sigma factor n=1 Tax=Pseudarthrobacter sp. R1 TaxID=2944934 RepID=UPI00210C2184|nr:sigma-70 family RNA polymerase sigma factor [Pseudarthrobacter sp. R1]MCQ6270830.1 sigma-70 family RNA polymerase sigma factor [Pseudarthrobacter sp. R1]